MTDVQNSVDVPNTPVEMVTVEPMPVLLCNESPLTTTDNNMPGTDPASMPSNVQLPVGIGTAPEKLKAQRGPKPRKRVLKEAGIKPPLNGYVRYMNERREDVRKAYPGMNVMDITKKLAEEWSALGEESKRPFLAAAEIDKIRFRKELGDYKQMETHDQQLIQQQQHEHQNTNVETIIVTPDIGMSGGGGGGGVGGSGGAGGGGVSSYDTKDQIPDVAHGYLVREPVPIQPIPRTGNYDIPIFTDEFLEHNKLVDTELRMLRKSNTDYEHQNAVLEKHIENMRNGIDKCDESVNALRENNQLLSNYLDKLTNKLTAALDGLPIPSEPHGATTENIIKYMDDLHSMVTSNSHGPASLNKARDVIRKLDLQIQV